MKKVVDIITDLNIFDLHSSLNKQAFEAVKNMGGSMSLIALGCDDDCKIKGTDYNNYNNSLSSLSIVYKTKKVRQKKSKNFGKNKRGKK